MNKKKIVIVEDDPFSQKFYQIILSRIGHEPILVNDYEELFNTLETKAVSLLIMDINLKNSYIKDVQHDGRSLARLIRENKNYVHIPIIIVTGFCSKVMMDTLIGDKIVDFIITKPIDNLNRFIEIINSHLAE